MRENFYRITPMRGDLALQIADDPTGVATVALEAFALEGVRSEKFAVS